MKLTILAATALLGVSALAATPTTTVVTCIAADTTSIVIQKTAKSTYVAQLRMAEEKAIQEFPVSKMIYSHSDGIPLAIVYISAEINLALPIAAGGADKLETQPRATLELTGHPQAWEMVCR